MLVGNRRVVVRVQVCGEGREAEGRKTAKYLIGRKNGEVASVSAGRISLTRRGRVITLHCKRVYIQKQPP